MQFAGFDDWIEIFRGGRQTDSAGTVHDGDALIDKAVAGFNAAAHEPPVVVGHPAQNAPAFGWVRGLKKSAKDGATILLAKFRDVVPEFEDLARRGMYKKRSAAFYPDGRLRHVGFLGAVPPAVKGLADIGFAEPNQISFEFEETRPWIWSTLAQTLRSLRDWLIEKEGKDTADGVIPSWNIEDLENEARRAMDAPAEPEIFSTKGDSKMTFTEFMEIFKFWKQVEKDPSLELPGTPAKPADAGTKTFSEADIEAARNQAAADAAEQERARLTAEFAENERQAKQTDRRATIAAWCEQMVQSGKITPAMVKYGLPEMLSAFADKEDTVEFGESKEKATLFERFKGLFETELPKMVSFKEFAGRDKDVAGVDIAGQMNALINQKMAANKDLSYGAAFAEVQAEQPDLAKEVLAAVEAVRSGVRQ